MNGVIKLVGLTIVTGAAARAGSKLWDDVLEEKTYTLVKKLKKKKESKKKESKKKVIKIDFGK